MSNIHKAVQQRQFESVHQQAIINIMYTASVLRLRIAQLLKPYNLTHEQFNVLRILRGQGDQPISLKELTCRMIDQSSNTSRIIERLRAKALIERRECPKDRRAVDILITDQGRDMLRQIDQEGCIAQLELSLSEEETQQLSDMLDRARENIVGGD